MRITTQVDKTQAVAALNKTGGIGTVLVPSFASALNQWLGETVSYIRENKLTGQVLNVRTGALRRSVIFTPVRDSGGLLTAQLQAGVGNKALVYARIHELGGIIRPVRAKYLRFKTASGNWVMTKQVRMPARPYMRPGVEEMRPQLVQLLEQKIEEYARD